MVVNPPYETWMVTDQLLPDFLYNSMTSDVATQVMGYESAKDLWDAIQELFEIQSCVEEEYLRRVFQTTRKGSLNMEEYLCIMKNHVDNIEQVGSLVSSVPWSLKFFWDWMMSTIPLLPHFRPKWISNGQHCNLSCCFMKKKHLDPQYTHKTSLFGRSTSINLTTSKWTNNGGQKQQGSFNRNSRLPQQ